MQRVRNSDLLGVMVSQTNGQPPLKVRHFYRHLCLAGAKIGVTVFIFSPDDIDWQALMVQGYCYCGVSGEWSVRRFPLPPLIYDRSFYGDRKKRARHRAAIAALKKTVNVRFLGNGLDGKWNVQQALMRCPALRPHLPHTVLYRGGKSLLRWLKTFGEAVMKPQYGSHGKGFLHIALVNGRRFRVQGRDRDNGVIDLAFAEPFPFLQWIEHFTGGRKYIIQEHLSLRTETGDAFDIRSLMQKNGSGNWQLTGMAVRLGAKGSVTANLHGGGRAVDVGLFLRELVGDPKSRELIRALLTLSRQIPPQLETHYGRLSELGIDFGIDRQGKVWILEVNSKPGRAVFRHTGNKSAERASVSNPVRYARYILERQLGG